MPGGGANGEVRDATGSPISTGAAKWRSRGLSDVVEIEIYEMIFKPRDQSEVARRIGKVERTAAMARAFRDGYSRRTTSEGFVEDCFNKRRMRVDG